MKGGWPSGRTGADPLPAFSGDSMFKVDLDVWGFPVPREFSESAVLGVRKGGKLCALAWRDGERGGVVNIMPESYSMLRMAGVPELQGRDGRDPLWCALRDLGAATGGLGLYSRAPLEYVFVERDGPVFTDEASAWYQAGQSLCHLDWVGLPEEGEEPCRVEVRLPWRLDLDKLREGALQAGWRVEPFPDYPALKLWPPAGGECYVVGLFPEGESYCLLPPDREAGDLLEAARRGYPAFEAVLPLLQAAEVAEPLAVDLFAGAGGLSAGLMMAGWKVAVAVEWDKNAAETYRLNHPDTVVICDDIARVDSWELLELCGGRKPDLVCGGPPCQGFSVAGDRDPNDPRNALYREFVRVVRDLEPPVVLMENVPGLLSMKTPSGEPVLDVIRRDFAAVGFPDLWCKVLNAANYGVPQARCRVIFVGKRGGGQVWYPVPTSLPAGVIEELEDAGLAGLFYVEGEPVSAMNPDPVPGELVLVQSTQGTWIGWLVRKKSERVWVVRDLDGRKRDVPEPSVLGFGRHTVAQAEGVA
ncbi:MAG: DNA cytosine methyltransferase [Bacillota bacterium]